MNRIVLSGDIPSPVNPPKGCRFHTRCPRATFKEQFRTYTDAVRMMFLPMLAVLGIIALAFLIVYIML